jgi:hypothetical protein
MFWKAARENPPAATQAQLHAYGSRDTVLQAIAFLTAHPPNEPTVEKIAEDSLRGSAAAKLAWPASAADEDIPTLILAGDQGRLANAIRAFLRHEQLFDR